MNIFEEHQDYKPFFENPEDDKPEIKSLEEFTVLEEWSGLALIEKTNFWLVIWDWFLNGLIEIQDKGILQICAEIEYANKYKEALSVIKEKINSLDSDQERATYLLEVKKEIDNSWIGMEGDSRYIDDDLYQYCENELEFLQSKMDFKNSQGNLQKSKKTLSHPQQMLLLERLGIIQYLNKYDITQEKKAVLIANIVGKDAQNTREFLGTMVDKNHKSTCNTQNNNDLIDRLFAELGIS